MPIKSGFVTHRNVDLMTSLDAAGRLGFDFAEILMHGSGHPSVLQKNARAVQERLNENDLSCVVHLPHSGIDIGSPLENVRTGSIAEVEESLRVAGRIDARKAVLHPTSNSNDTDERRKLMVDGVRTVADIADDHGVEICAENMHGKYATVHDVDDIVDETEASLTFDTGHARIEGFSATDGAAFLDEYRDRISHLHLNDTRGPVDEHLPVGAGSIDFETVLEPLRASGWDGTASLEVATENLAYIAHSKEHVEAIV